MRSLWVPGKFKTANPVTRKGRSKRVGRRKDRPHQSSLPRSHKCQRLPERLGERGLRVGYEVDEGQQVALMLPPS